MTVMTEPEVVENPLNIPQEIVLLGRKFSPAKNMTLERDMYVMSLMKSANIAKLFERKGNSPTFELDELAEAIIVAAFESGKMFEMTAAILDEEGVKWTRAGSVKLADWMSEITDREAKDILMQYIAVVILGFFLNGPGFSATLEESLALAAKAETLNAGSETSEPPKNESKESDNGELHEEPVTSVSGENSSDTSEDSIPTDTTPSSSGT